MEKQQGVTIWLTGLSGAEKSTICEFLEAELRSKAYRVEVLDGDVVRQNLSTRAGEIKHFTGIDDVYESPLAPDVECQTDMETVAESANKILSKLAELGYIDRQIPLVTTPS